MPDDFAPEVFPFCGYAVADPGLEEVGDCSGCGARFWVEGADDLAGVVDEAAEILQVHRSQVEYRIIRNYDRWTDDEHQPPELGEEGCLVFACRKPPA